MINQQNNLELSLAERAGWLNDGMAGSSVSESLKQLSEFKWLGYGIPERLGGVGGKLIDAVEAVATVSEQCLTSGYIFWCQRAMIECLVVSSNRWLQERILPELLQADCSGAIGLNLGTEPLSIKSSLTPETLTLEGFLPWVSNLQPQNFIAICAAQTVTAEPIIMAVPSSIKGLHRGEDLQLLGLQASWTSTLALNKVQLSRQWLVSETGYSFVSQVRPTLLFLQCGLSLGMVRRSLQETLQSINGINEEVLINRLQYGHLALLNLEAQVRKLGILETFNDSHFRQIGELYIALTRLALDSVWLELEAKGQTAYFKPSGTARRLREAAFLPILSPSLLQLEQELKQSAKLQMQLLQG